jgi:Gpi18-like mannosyltransferase
MKFLEVLKYILVWRIALFFILFLAIGNLPLQFNFLGGGLGEYLHNPYLWSWVHFDGEHYLSIAQNGYKPLEYFFFPFYPLLIDLLAKVIGLNTLGYVISGLIISHTAFLLGIFGFIRLIQLDYNKSVVRNALIILFLFPTSFYFVMYYTESLFFALTIWAFYFARRKNWILAGILGACACSTRIIGVALIPAFLIEAFLQEKKLFSKSMIQAISASGIALSGILLFMHFLDQRTGDPIAFFTSLNQVFGEQRSEKLILLPQVFYRYFVKILPAIDYHYFPQVFVTFLELGSGIFFLLILGLSFIKLRLSYAIYLTAGYLIPTLSGSFSSLPRYELVLFPAFILLAIYFSKAPRYFRISFYIICAVLLFLAESYFLRGYWIS